MELEGWKNMEKCMETVAGCLNVVFGLILSLVMFGCFSSIKSRFDLICQKHMNLGIVT